MFGAIVIFVIVMMLSVKLSSKNRDKKSYTPGMPEKQMRISGQDNKTSGPDPFKPKNNALKPENAGRAEKSTVTGTHGGGINVTPAVRNKRFWSRASRISSEKERLFLEMEDRDNDWLARQMKEEEQLAKKMCFR